MDELQAEEYKDFKENAELKAIIAGQNARSQSVVVNGIEIKIKAAIPKGLRDKLVEVQKQYEAGDINTADLGVYDVMAKLSNDEPWTKPEVWKYIDEETGAVPNLMKDMVEKITNMEGTAARFRRQ